MLEYIRHEVTKEKGGKCVKRKGPERGRESNGRGRKSRRRRCKIRSAEYNVNMTQIQMQVFSDEFHLQHWI
jgi:hypothetical protein